MPVADEIYWIGYWLNVYTIISINCSINQSWVVNEWGGGGGGYIAFFLMYLPLAEGHSWSTHMVQTGSHQSGHPELCHIFLISENRTEQNHCTSALYNKDQHRIQDYTMIFHILVSFRIPFFFFWSSMHVLCSNLGCLWSIFTHFFGKYLHSVWTHFPHQKVSKLRKSSSNCSIPNYVILITLICFIKYMFKLKFHNIFYCSLILKLQ